MKYAIGAFAMLITICLMAAAGDIVVEKNGVTKIVPCTQVVGCANVAISNGIWDGTVSNIKSVNTWVIRETGQPNVCWMSATGVESVSPASFNSSYPSGAKIVRIE